MSQENLIGVIDIVAAFTALRQDVKTQVRNGRELQEAVAQQLSGLDQRLQMLLQQLQSNGATNSGSAVAKSDSSLTRQLAEALAEVEEALQRALSSWPASADSSSPCPALLEGFDGFLKSLPWWARSASVRKSSDFRARLAQAAQWQIPDTSAARQGLNLILARVHRLMKQSGLERLDVVGQPFDAELMFAIDTIASSTVPHAHVAEQLRPAYLWQGKLLRTAEVRLAK